MKPHPKPRTSDVEPQPVTAVLEHLLATDKDVTVGEIFERVAGRGYGLLLIVLGLPMLIPILPPGASTIVGPIYMLLAIQLVVGFGRPWLPRWLRRRQLSQRSVQGFRRRGIPLVRRLERFSRRRFRVLSNPVMTRLAAVIIFSMGLILLSPAPFLNTLPALTVMLIGVGLLNDDGVFLMIGIFLGLVVVAVFAATINLAIVILQRLFPWWFR
ncbi:MAG: exopolysaccharide biosynthesis protein [Anaerolineales bacterium]